MWVSLLFLLWSIWAYLAGSYVFGACAFLCGTLWLFLKLPLTWNDCVRFRGKIVVFFLFLCAIASGIFLYQKSIPCLNCYFSILKAGRAFDSQVSFFIQNQRLCVFVVLSLVWLFISFVLQKRRS